MKKIGSVSSEGGPLLLADAKTACTWRGVEENGSDYERACNISNSYIAPGGSLLIGQDYGVIWQLGGAGTATIFAAEENRFVIVRAWLHDNSQEGLLALAEIDLQGSPMFRKSAQKNLFQPSEINFYVNKPFAEFEIVTGTVAVLWAAISGKCIQSSDTTEYTLNIREMATESSALLVKVPIGRYLCLHDEVRLADGQYARRCHLITQEAFGE